MIGENIYEKKNGKPREQQKKKWTECDWDTKTDSNQIDKKIYSSHMRRCKNNLTSNWHYTKSKNDEKKNRNTKTGHIYREHLKQMQPEKRLL